MTMNAPEDSKPTAPATRNTVQRALVKDAMRTLGGHPTPSEVFEKVREQHPRISRATVYRNLGLLSERGELQHVVVPNGADRYDLRRDPHYHLCCSRCGRIFDAEMPFQEDMADQLGDTRGFHVTGHLVIFTGLCADCRADARESAMRG